MIASNSVKRDCITIEIKDNESEWLAIASLVNKTTMTGYIRLDKTKGCLELCNFNAQMNRKMLDMGASSKKNDDGQAGIHGEGFKVGTLVMLRRGFQVRYEASQF